MTRSIAAALVVLLLAGATGCTTKTTHVRERVAVARPSDGLVIRTYEVPEDSAERYASVLRHLLFGTKKGELAARVGVLPDGRLVVVGPMSIQQGVEELVAGMKQLPQGPETVGITYWVVAARSAAELSLDPSLREIGDPLAELSKREGGLAFRAIDKIAVRSSSDARASHDGRRTEIQQTVHAQGDELLADLKIRSSAARSGPLDTQVPLVPGKPIVLGEMGVEPDLWPDGGEPVRTRVFYVVRAHIDG
jgi:hypothetical protein